jgi:hypothetical protein
MSYDPAEHTIDEVHAYLAEHPDEQAAVLSAEQARGDDARVTLVNSLEGDAPSLFKKPEGDEGEGGDEVVDLTAGYPDGEYPDDGITGYVVNEATSTT